MAGQSGAISEVKGHKSSSVNYGDVYTHKKSKKGISLAQALAQNSLFVAQHSIATSSASINK